MRGTPVKRVYTGDGNLDETLAGRDRDVAGPEREWAITNDPNHEWMLKP